jgi:hypothetical protein
MVRELVCDYCSHDSFKFDGDVEICIQCGAIRTTVSDERDYLSHKIVQKKKKKKVI